MFVPSKAFRIFLGDSCLILLRKTETFMLIKLIFIFLPESDKIPVPFAVDQYANCLGLPNFLEFLELQNYSKWLDYYRLLCFDRFCFLCVVCLFWWLYGFRWWVFAIEKLEYSIYNAKTKYELVRYRTYSSDLLSDTNGSHEGFVEFCVIEVFSSFGLSYDGWRKDVRA